MEIDRIMYSKRCDLIFLLVNFLMITFWAGCVLLMLLLDWYGLTSVCWVWLSDSILQTICINFQLDLGVQHHNNLIGIAFGDNSYIGDWVKATFSRFLVAILVTIWPIIFKRDIYVKFHHIACIWLLWVMRAVQPNENWLC